MNEDLFTTPTEGCEAVQFRISELADTGAPLTAELRAHVDACAECAQFAELWLAGAPDVLREQIPAGPDAKLRERILDGHARESIVPFPASHAASRASWNVWIGRIAACAVFATFSYWLLNPQVSPIKVAPAASEPPPTISQSLAQVENKSKREQEVLHTALVDGGREVHNTMSWSMSALEL